MECEQACGKSCNQDTCGACCGGGCKPQITITTVEYALLQQLAITPFLPVASGWDLKTPVYLEETDYTQEEYTAAIRALDGKGLIRMDYDIPLSNFPYQAYQAYPMHGSMALTGAGQEIVEQLEIQGIERDI